MFKYIMNFKEWLILEKTLYHGTVADYKNDIVKYGLVPGWHNDGPGDFVKHFYDDDEYNPKDYEIGVFMADKRTLHKAINAMHFHVAKKLNKDQNSLSDIDVRNHGLLAIIRDEDDNYKPYNSDPPDYDSDEFYDYLDRSKILGIEDGDYTTTDGEGVDYVLTGTQLIDFLKKNGYADHGKFNSDKMNSYLQGQKRSIDISKERKEKEQYFKDRPLLQRMINQDEIQ